jgi:sec-independent protein translocase protein TatC
MRPATHAARSVAATLGDEAGQAAAKRAIAALAEAGAQPVDPDAVAQAAVKGMDGADPESVGRAVERVLAKAGGAVDPKAVGDAVAEVVARATRRTVDPSGFLVAKDPVSMIMTSIYLCLAAAIALTIPVTGYELWMFVAPGLKRRERRFVMPILTVGTLLFLIGAAFAYFLALPVCLNFLMAFTVEHEGVRVLWNVSETLKFEAIIVLCLGVAFEMPLVIVALVRVGILDPKLLRKYRRHAILVIFVVTAIVSPTVDMVSELVLACPLVLLYEISIQACKFFRPRKTLWEPWSEKDYADAWETSAIADEDIPAASGGRRSGGASPSASSGGAAAPPTPPTTEGAGAPPPSDASHAADYSYEQQPTHGETDPYLYGENAYQPETWEPTPPPEPTPLERLRKDLKRRRPSRRVKRPSTGRPPGQHGRPNQ